MHISVPQSVHGSPFAEQTVGNAILSLVIVLVSLAVVVTFINMGVSVTVVSFELVMLSEDEVSEGVVVVSVITGPSVIVLVVAIVGTHAIMVWSHS